MHAEVHVARENSKITAKPYFAFQWHITDYCDQRCKHCYIFSEGKSSELLTMSMEHEKGHFLKKWDARIDYYAVVHVLLGYPRDEQAPKGKPRKDGRIIRV